MKRQNKGHQRIRKYKQVPNFLGQHFLHNIGLLNERQWGTIFQAMLRHVPSFRWPKTR